VLVTLIQLSSIVLAPIPSSADDPVVTFPDANLEAAIREAINKPTGDIYASELAVLTNVNASGRGIIDLTGIEYCTNITDINFSSNQIIDLTPLAELTKLVNLDLSFNRISDITPLSALTDLTILYLDWNQISVRWSPKFGQVVK